MEMGGWVYIMADRYRGGLYVGVSANLIARAHAHKEGKGSRHVADYAKTRLVYAERHEETNPPSREKSWSRNGAANGSSR